MFDQDIRQRTFLRLVNLYLTEVCESFQLTHIVNQGQCIFVDPKLYDLLNDSVAQVLREKYCAVWKLHQAAVIQTYKLKKI
jgi:hypothetical protein